MQAVLSAAATRHQASARSTRGASEKERAPLAAYIPTPDSTGIVENYEQLYPPGRWKDPCTYVKSSDTVEESTSFALANGFIYYMDERDKEWLDKNNEEARGEGTSAQGAISASTTRSVRSMKAKGKEPDVAQSVAMSKDEFELVMAIFEKVTHEKTEFLHHVSLFALLLSCVIYSYIYHVNIGSRTRRAVPSILRISGYVRSGTPTSNICDIRSSQLDPFPSSPNALGSYDLSSLARTAVGALWSSDHSFGQCMQFVFLLTT